jgi:23S rRNA pseudouridine2605 synthase
MAEEVRLQKVLAERGVASRRGSAGIIVAGRVAVNGTVVTEPGQRVDPREDSITVDGGPLPAEREGKRTILLHKPRGYICSRSSTQGKTVFDLLGDIPERIVPAGRLDKDSEGLLLLSNDGEVVEHFTHPRFGQKKVYRVTVTGSLAPEVREQLQQPLEIDGYTTQPARVEVLKREPRPVLEFVLNEGRNRQVRRLCERSGLRVHRLVRTQVGDLTLKGLKPGQWREVEQANS